MGGDDFPSSLDIVILESVWSRGNNGGNGQHNLKDIQEWVRIVVQEICALTSSDLMSKTLTF